MSAIQSDVQTEEQLAAPAPVEKTDNTPAPKTPREEAMEAIEARHHAQAAAENGYSLTDDADKDKEKDKAAETQLAAQLANEDDDDKKPDAISTPAPAPAPASVPSSVRIKVNGEEQDVPMDEVIRQYQKHGSADQRLAEATRLLREAQEREAQVLLYQQQAAQAAQVAQATQVAAPPVSPDPVVAESGKEFLKALFEGDEEHALNALNKVMQGRPVQPAPVAAPTLDVNLIAENVAQQVRHQMTVDSVLERNRTDYPELYADPDIEQLAASKIHALRQTGVDFATALNTVSEDFAAKFHWKEQREPQGRPVEKPAPTTETRAAKLGNKQRVDNVASLTTKTVTHDDVPEDTSAVIAQMRAARGGI